MNTQTQQEQPASSAYFPKEREKTTDKYQLGQNTYHHFCSIPYTLDSMHKCVSSFEDSNHIYIFNNILKLHYTILDVKLFFLKNNCVLYIVEILHSSS